MLRGLDKTAKEARKNSRTWDYAKTIFPTYKDFSLRLHVNYSHAQYLFFWQITSGSPSEARRIDLLKVPSILAADVASNLVPRVHWLFWSAGGRQ